MGMKRHPYKWQDLEPGDIISFRYLTKEKGNRLQTLLVLNPRYTMDVKGGKSKRFLVGIKIEEQDKITNGLRINKKQKTILERIGKFRPLQEPNIDNLYRLEIESQFIINSVKGTKDRAFDRLKKSLQISGQYRTYDYLKARRSMCFLEPIRVFTEVDASPPEKLPKGFKPSKEKSIKTEESLNHGANEVKKTLKDLEDEN